MAAAPLPYARLSLADWCASPERVAFAAELFHQPLFLDLVGVLANVRVVHLGTLDATTAAFLLGARSGQDQVITALLKAATPQPALPQELSADYGAENALAAWEKESDA
jgi:hypothetical protein